MTEATLKADLVKLLRTEVPNWVVQRHEDKVTSGIPDISITGNKRTIWLEVKYAKFSSKGIQELTMLRLANAGLAYYLVYTENTYLVDPKDIGKPSSSWNHFVPGIDHRWVLQQIGGMLDYRK